MAYHRHRLSPAKHLRAARAAANEKAASAYRAMGKKSQKPTIDFQDLSRQAERETREQIEAALRIIDERRRRNS